MPLTFFARAVVAVLALSTQAMALDLEWVAPPECPPAPTIELPGRAKVTIEQRSNSLWQLVILFQEPNAGERRLEATSCQDTVAAATLLLKLGVRGSGPRVPLDSNHPLPIEPVAEPAVPSAKVLFAVAGHAEIGLFSNASFRPALSVDVILEAVTAGLAVRIAPWVAAPGATVDIARPFEAEAVGCFMPSVAERASIGGCAALIGGFWRLSGRNLPLTYTKNVLHLAAEPQVRIRLVLVGSLNLTATAGVRFNLLRPQPVLDGREVLFTTPIVNGALNVALGWLW